MRTATREFLMGTLVLLTVLAACQVPAAVAQGTASEQDEVYRLLEQLAADEIAALDQWWTPMFVNNGWREPEVFYQLLRPDDAFQLNCTNPDGSNMAISGVTDNALYCDFDSEVIDGVSYNGGIYIPIAPFVELFTTGEFWGLGQVENPRYIPMAIIAHEFSHHVVFEIYHQANEEQGITVGLPGVPEIELIADCLAGAFMLAYSQVQTLTFDDVQGIIDGLTLIADPDTATVSHGTPAQRTQAFSDGFYPLSAETDTILTCYQNYWPAFMTALGDLSGTSDNPAITDATWIPVVGDAVVVAFDETSLWVGTDLVGTLPSGMVLTVTANAVVDEFGTIWIGVVTPDGYSGWLTLDDIAPSNTTWIPVVGDAVVVAFDETSLWVGTDLVGTLPSGMVLTVTADAVVDEFGTIWIGVVTPDGYSGWVSLDDIAPSN